jgi:hypothetical protein
VNVVSLNRNFAQNPAPRNTAKKIKVARDNWHAYPNLVREYVLSFSDDIVLMMLPVKPDLKKTSTIRPKAIITEYCPYFAGPNILARKKTRIIFNSKLTVWAEKMKNDPLAILASLISAPNPPIL